MGLYVKLVIPFGGAGEKTLVLHTPQARMGNPMSLHIYIYISLLELLMAHKPAG